MATKAEPKAKPFKRKCKLCGKFITDEKDAVEFKGGYVHSNCFTASVKTRQTQRTEKEEEKKTKAKAAKSKSSTTEFKIPKKGISEEEYAEKVAFFNIVKDIIKADKLPAKVFVMADKLKEKYSYFTYPGMGETLKYCQRRMDKELGDDCMGLIPYYYDEAMAEAERIKEEQQNAESTLDQMTTESEVVTIDLTAHKSNRTINIEEIG